MAPSTTLCNLNEESISVTINGTSYQVPKSFSEVSLNDYLRAHLQLTGTKVMCREGGCGACVVNVAYADPDPAGHGQMLQRAINSCLCPILSCDGWEITTVEGIGNQKQPHPIQSRLTEHYGSQCGYCTPGMVMSMYSLMQNHANGDLTKQQVEDSFGGNICRCTGYRPILDAFKSFANDTEQFDRLAATDIEDVGAKFCKASGKQMKQCTGLCHGRRSCALVKPLHESVASAAPAWYKPADLPALYQLIPTLQGNVYYVVGHTGIGVYNDAPYDAYVDLKGVTELHKTSKTANSLIIGANVSLTDVINLCNDNATKDPEFSHLMQLAALVSKTAQPPIRNAGCWAGNFAMKNKHKEMPSDSFVGFASMNARIFVGQNGQEASYSLDDLLTLDMSGKIILRAELPSFTNHYVFRTFKIMVRSQNTHAYVIAAFRSKVTRSGTKQAIITDPAMCFGNIAPQFLRAKKTEVFLTGKNLADPNVLQQALSVLNGEIVPTEAPTEASPSYKKSLCMSLFYKFALEVVGDVADPRFRSAIGSLKRPLSSGVQSYPTKEANYPLTKPIPKLESMAQCTGEAKYISDIEQMELLYAAFAVSTQGNSTIYRIDSSAALRLPGVLRVFTASDIPGVNRIEFAMSFWYEPPEELLASQKCSYAGQPVAIVVAVTRDIAEAGAKLVKITYTGVQTVVTTCEDAIAKQSFYSAYKLPDVLVGDAVQAVASATRKVTGEMSLGSQTHFHMETQVAVSYPTEDGVNVEAGTQWIDGVQAAIAQVTGLTKNRVSVTVKRNGGAFGGKITRNIPVASATAMAAYLLKRPVKMHLSFWDNSKVVGKRFPYFFKYEVGFDENGKIMGIVLDIYSSIGGMAGAGVLMYTRAFLDNGYKVPAWKISVNACKTHLPVNTACRSPASTEYIFMIEHIMEHVAHSLNLSAIEVKMANFYKDGDVLLDMSTMSNCTILSVTNMLLDSATYAERLRISAQFNQGNRWRKRALAVVPMRFPCYWAGNRFGCLVVIYHGGGSVIITHGGIEIGQGINTKVAQVVAYGLGIDMKFVNVQASTSINGANTTPTGGSITSELACMAAIDCCAQLNARLSPVRENLPNATWEERVEAAYKKGVDLTAWGWANPHGSEASPFPEYNTYGATCTEVELDILTGEYQILRMDILYDCGESMSPLIDVGQAEGGAVMGIGYYTSEEIIYDKKTGENLTSSTWTYKPPTTKDIPIDFRVSLLQNAPNPRGVLRSKIVGEPPLCMSASVIFALRNAIKAHLSETEEGDMWFRMDVPATPARVQQCCMLDISNLRYSQ